MDEMADMANALEKDVPMGISTNDSKPKHSKINKTENKSAKMEKYQPILNPLSEKIPTQNIFLHYTTSKITPNHNNHNTSTRLNHHPSTTTPSTTKIYHITTSTLTISHCQIYHHAPNTNKNIINHHPITNPIRNPL